MSQIWIEKMRAATSKVERDEILLREFRAGRKTVDRIQKSRHYDEVEDQLRALANLAFQDER